MKKLFSDPFINDMKSFMKPECSVTQCSTMIHPYKWAIVTYYLEKISSAQWILVITNSEGAKDFV